MFQYKTKITILGALAVTALMNFPRLLITLRGSELTKEQIIVSKANAPKFKAWLNLG